ncbi:MAG: S41 family peptidase [Brevinemataceae bacterium]
MNLRSYFLSYKKIIFAVSFIFVFAFGIFIGNTNSKFRLYGTLFGKESSNIDPKYFQYYSMFRETYQILKDEYINMDKLGADNLFTGAIKGMLSSTEDPYTDFLSPEIAKEFAANINASFHGVGIRIEMRNNWLTIVAPIAGTPAAQADLQPGDQIIKINDKSTEGMSSLEAVGLIRGKIGTTVELTILRPGTLQPFPIKLKRTKIEIDTIESTLIPYANKKIAYLKVIEFGIPTFDEFTKALSELLKNNPDGLILDVRNNPGGLLESVGKIADELLDEGLIVYTRGRIASEDFEFYATPRKSKINNKLPLVILANQGSASASEILIGALKDTGRAIIVGKQTFGKGCVQKTRNLSDGSLIKYTIAKYYTPAGHSIAQIGIAPDVSVDMWFDELTDIQKTSVIQLQMANHIPNFLQTNKNPTQKDIDQLYQTLNELGFGNVPKKTVKSLIRQRQNFTISSIYDLELDNQLVKALEVVSTNTNSKPLTYYHKPKDLKELEQIEKQAKQNKQDKNKV